MSGRYALIIANTEYIDTGLKQLTAPGKDAEDLAAVLRDPELCAFDHVNVLINQLSFTVIEAVDEFFDQKKPDDLLLMYFSGHGVRDELGSLYLAVSNTIRSRMRSTAVKSDYIREAMDQSRSKRQVLILDCCNSGAFAQGTKAATGVSIGTATAFEAGYGRIVLTASDATQFAWEGDQVIGETDNSLFTHFLVEGLKGEADVDSDGLITIDNLYDYAYEQVKLVTPKQSPSKFSSKQQGEIVLRQIMRLKDIKPITLPDELIEATEDSRTFVREGAVLQLGKLLKGKNLGLARSAREALERIERGDDSRRVSEAATQVLEPVRQAEKMAEEEQKARDEAGRIAILKAEEEQIAQEKTEAIQKTQEKAENIALQRANEERSARERAEQERLAQEKIEAERIAAQKAETERIALEKVEQERLAQVKAEAKRVAAKKIKEERAVPQKIEQKQLEQEKAAPLVSQEIAKPRTLVPQRALYSIIAVGLIVAFALIGRSIMQRGNAESEYTPTVSATLVPATEAELIPVTAPTLTIPTRTIPVVTITTTAPISPSETPSPIIASSTAGIETYFHIASSKAYLYIGPDLSFGLAVQKAYPRGEQMTVLARNPSGLWFLCAAADGNQGWLYRDWLDVDIDPLVIPTASFIPTVRPTERSRPGGGPVEPAPTCVFC